MDKSFPILTTDVETTDWEYWERGGWMWKARRKGKTKFGLWSLDIIIVVADLQHELCWK